MVRRWEASDFKTRPLDFVDERQKRSFDVYAPIFAFAAERLEPNELFVLSFRSDSPKCDIAAAARACRASLPCR